MNDVADNIVIKRRRRPGPSRPQLKGIDDHSFVESLTGTAAATVRRLPLTTSNETPLYCRLQTPLRPLRLLTNPTGENRKLYRLHHCTKGRRGA